MHIMEIAFYVLIGVFGLTSFIHLIFCLLEKEAWRKATKPLTTLLLTGANSDFDSHISRNAISQVCHLARGNHVRLW